MKLKRFFIGTALLLSALLTAGGVLLLEQTTYFQLYDRKNNQVVFETAIKPGDELRLEIEHSFEHIPWFETYTVFDDGSFNLDSIAVAGYGAGIPAEMDVPTRIENGMVIMENINSRFEALKWLTSSVYMKELQLNGSVIFDFRTLPDASLIKGHIIKKRGVSLRCLTQTLTS